MRGVVLTRRTGGGEKSAMEATGERQAAVFRGGDAGGRAVRAERADHARAGAVDPLLLALVLDPAARRGLDRAMRRIVAALLLACVLALPAAAADQPDYPKFRSLRSNEVYLRAGPGTQYPIRWVYRRKGLPIEVFGRYDVWRHVRDWQGAEGWIHVRLLSPQRTVIIKGDVRTIYQEPARDSAALAKLEPGVIANLLECRNAWCHVETRGRRVVRGWLLRGEIWGVTADETVD